MKCRRWLPVVALAALGTSSLMACILSLDETSLTRLDGGVEGGLGLDGAGGTSRVIDSSTTDVMTADGGPDTGADTSADGGAPCWWDGASPGVVSIEGHAYLDHIHFDVLEGAGPPFSVLIYDKGTPMNEWDAGILPACTVSWDDDGSLHPVLQGDAGPFPRDYDFFYQFTVLLANDGQDPSWDNKPSIDVQEWSSDEVPNPRSHVQVTCLEDAGYCPPEIYLDAD